MKLQLNANHYMAAGVIIATIAASTIVFMIRPVPYKESPRDDVNRGSNLVNNDQLYYVKDHRTDLCFAVHKFGWQDGLLTNVPCTDKVQQYLINKDIP